MENIKKYRIFGRTRGRSKKKIDISNYQKLLDEFSINKLSENDEYILDIGTGYGETSIYLSTRYKNNKIITCDKYINGNLNLLKKIKKNKINNIFVNNCNVHQILDNNNKGQFFKQIWIFFPDPWPKKKHSNRRLINIDFLNKVYDYLKLHGEIYIATDSPSYTRDLIRYIYNLRKMYKWINQNSLFLDIIDYFKIETKYYKKANISGRKTTLFILRKI
tara:strand:+ start:48 stop:704 length:657 start_codon:yes stop_codon:yes gene_type:complete